MLTITSDILAGVAQFALDSLGCTF